MHNNENWHDIGYHVEWLFLQDSTISLPFLETIDRTQSEFQKIEIVDSWNDNIGNYMLIDDIVMLTERDEFSYHEMIVHPSLQYLWYKEDLRILVIGGWDGGTVSQLTKYGTNFIKSIDLVEIDEAVITMSLKYFPNISKWFSDSRVNVIIWDAIEYVKNTSNTYDLVLIDWTDPFSVGEWLFWRSFYQNVKNILTTHGIVVWFAESPYANYDRYISIIKNYQSVFNYVKPYASFVPMYDTWCWIFVSASKNDMFQDRFLWDQMFDMPTDLKYFDETCLKSYYESIPKFAKIK